MINQSGVYIIQNKINKKVYIGASKNIYNRLCDHKYNLRKNIHHNEHLQSSFNKYGESNFTFDILEQCSENFIFSQENYWCNILNSHNPNYGYNNQPTSPKGKQKCSELTKKKMSNSAEKRTVVAYTIYGEYYKTFKDLHKCAKHFRTDPPNIHRKMNIKFFKKNLIDSISSKFIFLDENETVEDVKIYWNNIFNQIKLSNGKYEVYDCFHRFIGTIDSRNLADILNVHISSIAFSIKRNTYLRTLKIKL